MLNEVYEFHMQFIQHLITEVISNNFRAFLWVFQRPKDDLHTILNCVYKETAVVDTKTIYRTILILSVMNCGYENITFFYYSM
jgi:hypothetical protein